MRLTKLIANSLLLFTVPALAAYPVADIPDLPLYSQNVTQDDSRKCLEVNNELFSYDDVLDLIEEIEEGDIDERCSPEEIDGINRFMALLAKEGILPGDISQEYALNKDIEDLLSPSDKPWEFAYSLDEGYSIEPAVFYGNPEVLHCKSWFKKQWDQTRKFVAKHKKEIIIGAAIVIAVAVTVAVVVVVCSTSAAATVATGTAVGVASSVSGDSTKPGSSSNETISTGSSPAAQEVELVAIPVQEVPALKEVIDVQVESLKGQLAAESINNPERALNVESPSFLQDAREYGAGVAHAVFDAATTIVSAVPHLLEEVRDAGERFVPKGVCDLRPSETFNPVGNYEFAVDKGHKAIDQLFGVSQPQDVPVGGLEFTYAVLPPPGLVGPAVSSNGRLPITQANSTRGWKVGQPIQNRTWWGGVPKWSTVRQRHWKNMAFEAKSNPTHPYRDHIEGMERGLAPQRINRKTGQIESLELHHTPPQREGGLFDFIELWPEEHAEVDPRRYIGK